MRWTYSGATGSGVSIAPAFGHTPCGQRCRARRDAPHSPQNQRSPSLRTDASALADHAGRAQMLVPVTLRVSRLPMTVQPNAPPVVLRQIEQ